MDDPPLVLVSTAQQLKSTVREPVMLMLSSFLRVLVVSTLVHGVAATRHGHRRPVLVEPLPPPHPEPNQSRSRLHLAPRKLTDPFPTAHDRRSATAAAQFAAGPPLAVALPLQTTPTPIPGTHRCGSSSSTFPHPIPRSRQVSSPKHGRNRASQGQPWRREPIAMN